MTDGTTRDTTPPPGPMKPVLSYFGSKAGMAPWLVSMFPPHRVYVEPFCGSAAVLLAKPRSTHEIINDVDSHLVNFYRVARARLDDLEVACRLTPYSREEFDATVLDDPSIDELERARRYWVRSNQSFAQILDTGWSTSIVRNANNARSVWNRLGRLGDFVGRLGGVVIEHRDALDVIERYDAVDGLMYIDPPYLGSTRTSYRDGRRPGGDYAHEFQADDDHQLLAKALLECQATVFLSGYPSPLYDDLYASWDRIERTVVRWASNGRSGACTHVTEVVWCNREIPTKTQGELGLFDLEVGA